MIPITPNGRVLLVDSAAALRLPSPSPTPPQTR